MTSSQQQRCQIVRSSYLSSMSAIMSERMGLNALMQVGAASGHVILLAFDTIVESRQVIQMLVLLLHSNSLC